MTADPRLAACRARLDEMQQDAEKATPGPWEVADYREVWCADGPVVVNGDDQDGGCSGPDDAAHIAAWSPSVALAHIAGLRVWLDSVEQRLARHDDLNYSCPECDHMAPCEDRHLALADLTSITEQLGAGT